jgi:lipopolysaccharide/colanic/teichoic acid biosynthesis glycosyltransferase
MKALEYLAAAPAREGGREVLNEERFRRRIAVERKRTERTREPFLLMLLACAEQKDMERQAKLLDQIMAALAPTTRETDCIGWYRQHAEVGALFTGLPDAEKLTSRTIILNRVTTILREELPDEQFRQISLTFHFFPDDWGTEEPGSTGNPLLYPDLVEPSQKRRALLRLKRMIDLFGGLLLLILTSPLLIVIAAAVKATSRGPILFRQPRVGQYGRRFTFLKFRSMYVGNDDKVHQEYVKKLIAGNAERVSLNANTQGVYKLAHDSRITPIGKFLRRSSLDELPQFINVILGDMSLVGPRPPLPYELAAYQTWHRRRLLLVKPGITGLWQVKGRSRVTFEDMVRLDLQYATAWSPWLDIKILLLTPGAVIKGAY